MKSTIVRSNEGTRFDLMGDEVRVILGSEQTGGGLTLVQQRSAPGAGVPLHVNTKEDETFQVLEGSVEFQVGAETVIAEAGTVVHVQRNLHHSFRIVGADPALIQIMMVPGGLEKMVERSSFYPSRWTGKRSEPSANGLVCNSCTMHRRRKRRL
jgi:quercetin dioxygenase-like cupin family protein